MKYQESSVFKFIRLVESAAELLKGYRITEEEYNAIIRQLKDIDYAVLRPAIIRTERGEYKPRELSARNSFSLFLADHKASKEKY